MILKGFISLRILLKNLLIFILICLMQVMLLYDTAFAGDSGTNIDLVHYWHFNDLEADPLSIVLSDSSAVDGSLAFIMYQGEGQGYMDRVEGTTLNAWADTPSAFGLRVRNPSDDRTLLIQAPSMNYTGLVLSYALHRTTNGAREQRLLYSVDGGRSWNALNHSFGVGTEFTQRRFDLSDIPEADNNPGLQFRILFLGGEASGDTGNNRFDNIRLDGVLIDPTNMQVVRSAKMLALHNFPNPFRDMTTISFHLPEGDVIHSFEVIDTSGRVVYVMDTSFASPGQHHVPFDASLLGAGVYWVHLVTNKSVITHPMVVAR